MEDYIIGTASSESEGKECIKGLLVANVTLLQPCRPSIASICGSNQGCTQSRFAIAPEPQPPANCIQSFIQQNSIRLLEIGVNLIANFVQHATGSAAFLS